MFRTRPEDIVNPWASSITRNSYIMTAIFIISAMLQWYFVQTFVRYDISKWSTLLMLIAFVLVSFFHILPPIRRIYPYNYIFVITTAELMILGAGAMTVNLEYGTLISVMLVTAFFLIFIILLGAILEENWEANPFCFLTAFFLNFMITTMLIYMHLALETLLVLELGRAILVYTITGMIIYHSMVLQSGQTFLHEYDFLLMGLLFCVDYICLFVLALMYFQNYAKKTITFRSCG